jgi:hypothetical protein
MNGHRMAWCGLDSSVSGLVPAEGSSEQGNETLGSIKCWKILE